MSSDVLTYTLYLSGGSSCSELELELAVFAGVDFPACCLQRALAPSCSSWYEDYIKAVAVQKVVELSMSRQIMVKKGILERFPVDLCPVAVSRTISYKITAHQLTGCFVLSQRHESEFVDPCLCYYVTLHLSSLKECWLGALTVHWVHAEYKLRKY